MIRRPASSRGDSEPRFGEHDALALRRRPRDALVVAPVGEEAGEEEQEHGGGDARERERRAARREPGGDEARQADQERQPARAGDRQDDAEDQACGEQDGGEPAHPTTRAHDGPDSVLGEPLVDELPPGPGREPIRIAGGRRREPAAGGHAMCSGADRNTALPASIRPSAGMAWRGSVCPIIAAASSAASGTVGQRRERDEDRAHTSQDEREQRMTEELGERGEGDDPHPIIGVVAGERDPCEQAGDDVRAAEHAREQCKQVSPSTPARTA